MNEIKEVLASMGLRLGMDIPGRPPENIEEMAKKLEQEQPPVAYFPDDAATRRLSGFKPKGGSPRGDASFGAFSASGVKAEVHHQS